MVTTDRVAHASLAAKGVPIGMDKELDRPAVRAGVGVVVAVALAACGSPSTGGPTRPESGPATAAPTSAAAPSTWRDQPEIPVAVAGDLWVGGEQVRGRWYAAAGRGSHWVALRGDRTWWWGFDAVPQRIDGRIDQSVVISPGGGFVAHVLTGADGRWRLTGADTAWGGEGLGAVDLPRGPRSGPPPRAIAVSDDGLVVAGGPGFQWLWRPLVDGATVDLAETAPGQVVIGDTDAGLVVNAGRYDRTDGQMGEPYLATLSPDGSLTRLATLPTHDVLEASGTWVAWVPPGTVGGEASGTSEVRVQRLDGTDAGLLTAPDGWLFVAPGFRWESSDRLLALLVSRDGQFEALARCAPQTTSCEPLDVPD